MITVTLINVVNSCPRPWGIRAPDTRKMIDLDVMWEAYTDQHRNSIQNLESKRISASQSRLLIVVLGSADGRAFTMVHAITVSYHAIMHTVCCATCLDDNIKYDELCTGSYRHAAQNSAILAL